MDRLKLLKIHLLSSTAIAPPITADAGFVVAGLTAIGLSATASGIILNILVSIAISALAMLLMPKPEATGGIKTEYTQTGETTPAKFILGRYATAGAHACPPMTTGGDENKVLTYVITLSDIPVTEITNEVVIDGRAYVANGTVDEWGVTLGGEQTLKDYFKMRTHLGDQTTADLKLVQEYGSYERPWANTAILSGVAYVADTFVWDDEKYSGLPAIKHVVKGIKLYDPRKDSTNGGTGTHRYSDQSTWEYSENPIVCVYNILRGIPVPGGSVYGVGATADSFINSSWFAAMNLCDENGTEPTATDWKSDLKRYRCGYEVSFDQEPAEVIDDLLAACGGIFGEQGGMYFVSLKPTTPVVSITDDDLISDNVESQSFQPLQECVNTIRATYPAPRKLWETEDATPFSKPEWIADDQGVELVADLKLTAVPYPRQVRRLLREAGTDHRRRRIHTITLPPRFAYLNLFDQIIWTSPARYYDQKRFEIQGIQIAPDTLNLTLNIRERDPADYDLDAVSDAVIPTVPSVSPVIPTVSGVYGFDFVATTLSDGSGVARKPAVKISWSTPNTWRAIAYEIKGPNGTIFKSDSTSNTNGGQIIISDGVLPSATYQARVKVNERTVACNWSDWKSVTTSDLRIRPEDIADTVWDQVADTAALSGITTVSVLPASGTLNQIVMLVPPGRLYRWTGTVWSESIYADIQSGSLTATDFASSIEPVSIINGSVVPTTLSTRLIFLTGTGKTYRWNGSAYIATVQTTDLSGTLTAAQIASVNASAIAGQITSAQIANNAITATQLSSGVITPTHFASSIEPVSIINGSTIPTTLSTRLIFLTGTGKTYRWNGSAYVATIPTTDLSGTLTAAQIAAVNASTIAGQITETQIGDDAISTRTIAANAITANEIASGSIQTLHLTTNCVTANEIASNSITSSKIEADSVTAGKIAAGAVGADQIAARAISAKHLAIADLTNLAPNGSHGLENADVNDFWSATAAVTVNYSSTRSTVGLYSLVIGTDLSTGGWIVSKSYIPVAPGEQYFCETKHRSNSTATSSAGYTARIFWYDANKAAITPQFTDFVTNQSITTAWQIKNANIVVPEGAAFMRVYLYNASSNTTVPEIVVDYVTVRRRNGGELLVDGSITTNHLTASCITADNMSANSVNAAAIIAGAVTTAALSSGSVTAINLAAGAVTTNALAAGSVTASVLAADSVVAGKVAAGAIGASEIAAGAISAKHLVVADTQNLIPNGGMSDPAALFSDYWQYSGTGASGSYSTTAVSGLYSAKLTRTDATQACWMITKQKIPVVAGSVYRFTTKYRGSAASAAGVYIQIMCYDILDAYLSAVNPVSNVALTTAWVDREFEVTIPANTVYCKIRVLTNSANTVANSIFVDYIKLVEKNAGSLIVDGSIQSNHLAAGSVTTNALAAGSVTATQIAAGSIAAGSAIIASGAIGTAQIADAAITTAKIGDLAVDTLQIANNAVTIPVSSYVAGAATFGGGEVTVGTVTITRVANQPTKISFSAVFALTGYGTDWTTATANVVLTLYRNGTAIYTGGSMIIQNVNNVITFFYNDTNTAGGATTYTVGAVRGVYGSFNISVARRSLEASIVKK